MSVETSVNNTTKGDLSGRTSGTVNEKINPWLPMVPEEVTSEWLSQILAVKVKCIEFTHMTLLATTGKIHATVTYDDKIAAEGKPTYICIKGGFNPTIIATMPHILISLTQREADFFKHIGPSLRNIHLLKSWWSGTNSKQGIVVFDDLAKNMKFGEPTDAWPVERVLQGVEQLAGLHASTWGKTVADFPWLRKPEHYDATIMQLVRMWKDMAHGEGRPRFPADWNEARIRAVFEKHFARRDPRFRCLLHGDPHCGNTWLDNGKPRFLDWQLIHVGSAFHDVAYFVVGALTGPERKAHEMAILEHYLGALSRFGGPSFTLDEVLPEYRKSTLSGIGWALTPYNLQPRERVLAMTEKYLPAIIDHKAVELVESSESGLFGD